uniref:NTR domain-containing protein n=2 Tax=Strongyloides stercoralis TaxID=6248 RepID=A0A0K0EPX3_STRER
MIGLTFILSIILTTLVSLSFSCGSFNCRPYGNKARITYEVEPSLYLTYNPTYTRVNGQHSSSSSLANSLNQLATNEIYELVSSENAAYVSYFTPNVKIDQYYLLSVEIIPSKCKNVNGTELVAYRDTYFVQNGLVMQRNEDTNCINGTLEYSRSSPAKTKLVYTIDIKIPTGQKLCYDHWTKMSEAIKDKITIDTNSNFLNTGTIERA